MQHSLHFSAKHLSFVSPVGDDAARVVIVSWRDNIIDRSPKSYISANLQINRTS